MVSAQELLNSGVVRDGDNDPNTKSFSQEKEQPLILQSDRV